ncbi:unnamed protein product, partial [marine sediment metagenome]
MPKVVELPKQEVNEEVKTGGNGHKPGLKQKFVSWLLKDVHIKKLYIGDHTTVLENDIIKMAPLGADPGSEAEGWLWFLAAAVHKLRFRDNTGAKDVGEGAAPGEHALAGGQHSEDTLANLNDKVSDADLANEAEVIKKDGSAAFTGDQSMGGNRLTNLPTPIAGNEPATKDHVDSVLQGLDWQPSVLDELADPPGTPAEGDRYLVIATATGDWAEH